MDRGFLSYLFALLVLVLSSQDLGDLSIKTNSEFSYRFSLSAISDAKQKCDRFAENESEKKNKAEIALSESRHITILSQEDWDCKDVSTIEFYYSNNVNNRLNSQKADLFLKKDLSLLQVLII